MSALSQGHRHLFVKDDFVNIFRMKRACCFCCLCAPHMVPSMTAALLDVIQHGSVEPLMQVITVIKMFA